MKEKDAQPYYRLDAEKMGRRVSIGSDTIRPLIEAAINRYQGTEVLIVRVEKEIKVRLKGKTYPATAYGIKTETALLKFPPPANEEGIDDLISRIEESEKRGGMGYFPRH